MRTTTKIVVSGFLLSIVASSFLLYTASAITLTPKYLSTAITIDGSLEAAWENQENTVFTNVSNNVLKMYVTMFADWIYFGLEYRTDTHNANESFALACANVAPENTSVVVNNVLTYDAVKCVQMNGRSWDLEVVKAESRIRNNTKGNYLGGSNFKVDKTVDNHTVYEFRFMVQSNRTGDIDWMPSNTTVRTVTLFYGNTFKNESSFFYPDIEHWASTTKTGIIVKEKPEGKTNEEIEALELNILVGEVTTFIIAGCIFGYVGVFIKSTGSRIKRRW